jgi:hypothetical protein
MIHHHDGAVTMARTLLRRPGAAYDPALFEFVNEVVNEQEAEIERMGTVLAGLSQDPRSALAPGFANAGQAARNMTLVASLPKPTGFFDPNNPAGLPPTSPERPAAASPAVPATPAAATVQPAAAATPPRRPSSSDRSPLLSFANTDMAFAGNLLAVGNYHGFNLYRVDGGTTPRLISSVICPGGQGDVSIVGELLIMSVEQTRGRVDCGPQGRQRGMSAPSVSAGFASSTISDPARPVQVGQVQTCRGSQHHSVVSPPTAPSSSTIPARPRSARARSSPAATATRPATNGPPSSASTSSRFRSPTRRARASSTAPPCSRTAETGRLAGLWQGGTHGRDTQETRRTDQCHDITVFPGGKLAAGRLLGQRHHLRHLRSAAGRAPRRRRRPVLRLLALGDLQQ